MVQLGVEDGSESKKKKKKGVVLFSRSGKLIQGVLVFSEGGELIDSVSCRCMCLVALIAGDVHGIARPT